MAGAGGRGIILQVDRVASVEEALAFRDAGANLIGIAVDPDPGRFRDERFVSPETARAIKQAIAPARLVGLVPYGSYGDNEVEWCTPIRRLLSLGPDFLQFYRGYVPDELVPAVRATGVPVIIDGAEMEDGDGEFVAPDDPVSFFRFYAGLGVALAPVLLHADVIPNYEHSWAFLTDEAPKWPEECLQVRDVAAATRAWPLLLSLTGVRPDEIGPYTQAFPDARGFFARLGPAELTGPPSSRPETVLAALHALQAPREGIRLC